MPTGRTRDRRRPTASEGGRDPGATEAYEHGWYALLARQASEEHDGDPAPPTYGSNPEAELASQLRAKRLTTVRSEHLATVEPKHLATVTSLAPSSQHASDGASSIEAGSDDGDDPAETARPQARASGRRRSDPIRLGVRLLEDPEGVYLRYLTSSAHRDFYRAGWWPISRTLSPAHLWRANHLGADWTIGDVRRFMDVALERADRLVAAAPNADRPGTPERRAWMKRFLSTEWVHEFGIGRIAKTLLPLVPELVPDLDPEMLPWATASVLGVAGTGVAEEADRCLESWELMEDVLVLRGQQLGLLVRHLRRLAPGIAPVGRLGLVTAACWDAFWVEAAAALPPPARRTRSAPPKPAAPRERRPSTTRTTRVSAAGKKSARS